MTLPLDDMKLNGDNTPSQHSVQAYRLAKLAETLVELGGRDDLMSLRQERLTSADPTYRLDPQRSRARTFVAKVLETNCDRPDVLGSPAARPRASSLSAPMQGATRVGREREAFYAEERSRVQARLEQVISSIIAADSAKHPASGVAEVR